MEGAASAGHESRRPKPHVGQGDYQAAPRRSDDGTFTGLGLYRDTRKESGHYYLGFTRTSTRNSKSNRNSGEVAKVRVTCFWV